MEMTEETTNSKAYRPLVSVLMTVYNRQDFIGEAIESVLKSSYPIFELIIVDDCSKDNSVEIVQGYVSKDSRISLYVNEKNLGDYCNRNKAATYAKGKYIKYLDSDDKFYDFSLDYCVNIMEQNPGAKWGLLSFANEDEGILLTPEQSMRRHFITKPFLTIGPDGSIYKKEFFEKIGGFSTIYGPANDVFTNIMAAANGNLVLMTKDFFYYRLHDGQEMNNRYGYLFNNYCLNKDLFSFLKVFFTRKEILYLENKNKRRFTLNILRYFLDTLNFPKTYFAIKQAKFSIKDAFQGIFH